MAEVQKNSTGRVCKWDNLKCFLIVAVVAGHFVNKYTPESDFMKSLSLFIYAFHMPLFIFLSGLLERKWNAGHPFRWSRPVYYIMIGYLLKFSIYAIRVLFHKNAVFHWFSDTGIPWYMFAMAAFLLIAYALKDIDPRIVLPVSVLLACLAGYDERIGSFLYLSRILVFFPFYYLGYCLDMGRVKEGLDRTWVKCLSAIFMVVALLTFFSEIEELYSYIRLFTGRNAYTLIHVENCGFMHRLGFYGLAVLLGAAAISLIPNRKLPLAGTIGQRTLQIYFWHRLALYVLVYSGAVDVIKATFASGWESVYLMTALAFPVIFSAKVFALPLTALKNMQQLFTEKLLHVYAHISGWLERGLAVFSTLEFIALLFALFYYGVDFGVL